MIKMFWRQSLTLAFDKHTLERRPWACSSAETCSFKKASFILMVIMRMTIVAFSYICFCSHDNRRGLWRWEEGGEEQRREKMNKKDCILKCGF